MTRQQKKETLSPALEAFMHRIFYRVRLSKKETRLLREDFLRLISRYKEQTLTDEEIESRIGDGILGDFYKSPSPAEWYSLDSAAKVYPLAMTHGKQTTFRVSVYLSSPVVPEILQVALLSAIKRFPLFSCMLQRGVFWHYFDAIRCRFGVQEEKNPPCSYKYIGGWKTPCFQVLYYKSRISLEIFHALTDGAGAMVFLKSIVREYLRLSGVEQGESLAELSASPILEEAENAFSYAEKKDKGTGFLQHPALQPGAGKRSRRVPRILHFMMDTASLIAAAKTENATVTAFLASCILKATKDTISFAAPDERLQLQIPVNMRKIYPSATLRNFSLYAVISVPYKTDSRDEMLQETKTQLAAQLDKDSLAKMRYSANQMATNPFLRWVPLSLKAFVVNKIYGFLGERVLSATLSNLGKVEENFDESVQFFDFVLGKTSPTNIKCTLVTYKDKAVLTVTDSLKDTDFHQSLAKSLSETGVLFYVEGVAE